MSSLAEIAGLTPPTHGSALNLGALIQSLSQRGVEFGLYQDHSVSAQTNKQPSSREGVTQAKLAQIEHYRQDDRRQLLEEIKRLRSEYVFRNEEAIIHFLSAHRTAHSTLSSAVLQLKMFFGRQIVLNLEAMNDEEFSTSLYAIVVWRGSATEAEEAMEQFDEQWWLDQNPQAGLNFTYELT